MPIPPTGTVTFLFTDIEGSTRHAQQFPAAWPGTQARHHAILQGAIDGHGGYVFQVIGDAFCAAFHAAPDALAAALDAQRALQAERWGDAVVGVRMGLHTGSATARPDGDYEGYLTLVRVQRIMSAAYGRQMLLSQSTAELVGDALRDGVGLRDLGTHRLKDLGQPEHLHQLVAPNLSADFPPLKTADHPNNLPRQLTSFIGREKEVVELRRLLADSSLLTLSGAGGVGKTRLALQVATEELVAFPDGVWLVELAPLADPALIPSTIASAIGVREAPGSPILTTLSDYFRQKSALVVLDNCEHVLTESAHVASYLLHAGPRLKIIATSREALGIGGEQAYRVPSLGLPEAVMPLDTLSHVESVRLFAERARAAKSDFSLTTGNGPAIAQICRRLDGVPLAIELAAARVKVFSPEQIAARLDDRFRLLTGGSRTALPRQQTLRAAIDWSYNLLSEPERALLRHLSVFAGGWAFEAAEAVCSDEHLPAPDVLDLLTHLIDKSLVVSEEQDGEVRYRLLETVRQYAREKLLDAGETEALRDRHLDYFVRFAEEGGRGIAGRDQVRWEKRLETEFDNMRVALDWAADAPSTMAGFRILGALWFFMFITHTVELLQRSRLFLSRPDGKAPSSQRARLLAGTVLPAEWVGSQNEAATLADDALSMARTLSDRWAEACALLYRNIISESAGAQGWMSEALEIARSVGDPFLEGFILWEFAESWFRKGEYAEAEHAAIDSIAVLQSFGEQHLQAGAQRALARVLMHRGDSVRAMQHLRESMRLNRSLGEELGRARCLCVSAEMATLRGDHARAMRLCGATLAWVATRGLRLAAMHEDRNAYERTLATAQAHLDPAVFDAALEEGQRMSLDEAVGYALEEAPG